MIHDTGDESKGGTKGEAHARISLRDFQQSLTERLASAQRGESTPSLLGIASGDETLPGGNQWLIDLTDSGEVVPLPTLTPVPLTQPWFVGLANVRGTLYGVTDFSAWRGGAATPLDAQARLLLIGARHDSNCALLVGRALGLRPLGQFRASDALPPVSDAEWLGGRFHDDQGNLWTQLRIPALLASPTFLDVAATSTSP